MPCEVIDRNGQARGPAATGIILYPMGGHGVPCPYVRTIFDVCILLCIQFVEGICLCEVIDRWVSYGRGNPLWLPRQARGPAATGIILYPIGGHGVPCPYVKSLRLVF